MIDTTVILDHAAEIRGGLRREMDAAVVALSFRQMEALRGLGLPAAHLFANGRIGATIGSVDGREYWQPDEEGRPLLITPLEEGGRTIDLVAFDPRERDTWYLRTGEGWALGHDAVTTALGGWDADARRLFLHSTPMDWLQSGCIGACVTSWCDEARVTLRDIEAIDVAASSTAQHLRLELSRPPRLPAIDVRRWRADAA